MRLQAGEGQIETRERVRKMKCPGLWEQLMPCTGNKQLNRWTDTQPFHEHCPFHSISALLSLQPLWQGRPE